MNRDEQAKQYAERVANDYKKAIEDAYYVGHLAGEGEMYHEMLEEQQKGLMCISFNREDLGISMWFVVQKEIYRQFGHIFTMFDARILDIILEQAGLPTYEEDLKNENLEPYVHDNLEDQRQKIIEIFQDAVIEVFEGGRPMTSKRFDEVWKDIFCRSNEPTVYDETPI